jgi:hypothetical protein
MTDRTASRPAEPPPPGHAGERRTPARRAPAKRPGLPKEPQP